MTIATKTKYHNPVILSKALGNLPARLRFVRGRRNLTIEELALQVKIPYRRLLHMETDAKTISFDVLDKLTIWMLQRGVELRWWITGQGAISKANF